MRWYPGREHPCVEEAVEHGLVYGLVRQPDGTVARVWHGDDVAADGSVAHGDGHADAETELASRAQAAA